MPSTVAARHDPAIVASGADAETWLDIAQTYRGSSRAHVAWGMRMGARGRWATRSRAGVHGSFCSPAAVSRYPGAVVAGSARTRSTRADPAISGVSSSPSCFRYASSVWPPRAAYARTPRLPTSPNGVILGITAVTVMPSPARRDSSWAYPAMNRWVALDPAYPPLAGDPLMAAPLLTTTTTTLLPGGSGCSSASRSQVNAILTSACQLTENVSHVWYWSGRITGLAPATRMRTSGWYWSSRLHATVAPAASAASAWMLALVAASSASAGPVRATATTGAPASANARAIPRPKPRLAPTTTVVLPDKSLIIVLFLCMSMVSLAVVLVVAAPPEAGLVATEWRAVEPLVHAPEAVHPAFVRRVGVVYDAILERERAHAGPFSPVRREVRSNARRPLGEHGTLLGGPKVHRAEVVLDGSRLPL